MVGRGLAVGLPFMAPGVPRVTAVAGMETTLPKEPPKPCWRSTGGSWRHSKQTVARRASRCAGTWVCSQFPRSPGQEWEGQPGRGLGLGSGQRQLLLGSLLPLYRSRFRRTPGKTSWPWTFPWSASVVPSPPTQHPLAPPPRAPGHKQSVSTCGPSQPSRGCLSTPLIYLLDGASSPGSAPAGFLLLCKDKIPQGPLLSQLLSAWGGGPHLRVSSLPQHHIGDQLERGAPSSPPRGQ